MRAFWCWLTHGAYWIAVPTWGEVWQWDMHCQRCGRRWRRGEGS